jgi:hypothetical protein
LLKCGCGEDNNLVVRRLILFSMTGTILQGASITYHYFYNLLLLLLLLFNILLGLFRKDMFCILRMMPCMDQWNVE